MSIEAMKIALEALEEYQAEGAPFWSCDAAADALRAAIKQAQPDQANQQKTFMSITDDHGKPLRPQYRVIEKRGKWVLLYDQHQSGEVVRHEFRIQKLQHDIALYPGIALAEAQKRFCEKVESDHE